MTRVEAAVDDLAALTAELRAVAEGLGPVNLELTGAIWAAWATSAGFLGPRTAIDDELAGARRGTTELAEITDGVRRRVQVAGTVGPSLQLVAPGSPASAGTQLAASMLMQTGTRLVTAWWHRVAAGLRSPALPVAERPFVVSTHTEQYAASLYVDADASITLEVRSDGTASVTAQHGGGVATGVGVGVGCVAQADGQAWFDKAATAAANVRVGAAAGQVWHFDSVEEAERWLDRHRNSVRLGFAARAVPVVGPVLDTAQQLRNRLWPGDGPMVADETFEQVGVEASLDADARAMLGSLVAGASIGNAIRHHSDGTLSLTGTATVQAAGATRSGSPGPGLQGSAGAQLDMEMELIVSTAGLQSVVLRSSVLDNADQSLQLADVLDHRAIAATGSEELSIYESTLTLDLSDQAVRDALESSLGIDLDAPLSAVQAALATLTLDDRVLTQASVSVLERSRPHDQRWALGCSVDAPLFAGAAALGQGITTQVTRAAWEKPSGATELREVR